MAQITRPEIRVRFPRKYAGLMQPYRYKAFWGGRGAGKSHHFAEALILKAYNAGGGGLRVLCGREKQNSIKESVKKLLDDKIRYLGAEKYFISTRDEIRGVHNNSSFMFTGFYQKSDSIKSIEGIDVCWVEEAHTLTQESLDILLPTVRKINSELWFSWNPKTETDPIGKMFFENPPADSLVVNVGYEDNQWFPKELEQLKEYHKKADYDMYRHIWLGQPVVHTEFQVFKNWKVDNFETPSDAHFLFGADWGFAVDPTVLLRAFVDEDARRIYIDYEAYALSVEISDTPALFDKIPEARKWTIVADSARPEIISHLNNNGFNVKKAKKGAGSVESGVKFLQDWEIVVHERCKESAAELSLYSYVAHRQTGKPTPKLEDKHNHAIDCMRYLSEDMQHNRVKNFRIRRVG